MTKADHNQDQDQHGAPERHSCTPDRRQRTVTTVTEDPNFVEHRAGQDRRRGLLDRRLGLDRRRGPGKRRSDDRRAAEEGMRRPCLYLATVRRAMSTPSACRCCMISSSLSGQSRASAPISA